jgi:hypothetical protein
MSKRRGRRVIDVGPDGQGRVVVDRNSRLERLLPRERRARRVQSAELGQFPDPEHIKRGIDELGQLGRKLADVALAPIDLLFKLEALPRAAVVGYALYRVSRPKRKPRRS